MDLHHWIVLVTDVMCLCLKMVVLVVQMQLCVQKYVVSVNYSIFENCICTSSCNGVIVAVQLKYAIFVFRGDMC